MLCKYYLTLGNNTVDISNSSTIDCSDMISNLSDVSISFARVDLGGVIRKCGTKFNFIGKARKAIIEEYRNSYLDSKGAILVRAIDNNWNYNDFWTCPLDFSTLEFDTYKVTISCLDNSAAAIIKAKKSTKYEMPVSSIVSTKQVYMDSVLNKNSAVFKLAGESVDGQTYTKTTISSKLVFAFVPPLYQNTSDITVNNCIVLTDQAVADDHDIGDMTSHFAECIKACTVNIDMSSVEMWGFQSAVELRLVKFTTESSVNDRTIIFSKKVSTGSTHTRLTDFVGSVSLSKGEKLQLVLFSPPPSWTKLSGWTLYMNNAAASISWNDRSAAINIDCILPSKLLDRVLKLMSADAKVYMSGSISPTIAGVANERLNGTVLMASESIRNFQNAKAYSSFNDFCDFMQYVFGYIYDVTEGAFVRPTRLAESYNSFTETLTEISSYSVEVSGFCSGTDFDVVCYNNMFFARKGTTLYIYWEADEKYYSDSDFNTYNVDVPYNEDPTLTYTTHVSKAGGYVDIEVIDSNGSEAFHMTGRAKQDVIFYCDTDGRSYESNGTGLVGYVCSNFDDVCFSSVAVIDGIDASNITLNTTEEMTQAYEVIYSTVNHAFVAKASGVFYSKFSRSADYNSNGYPRMDVYFNYESSANANKKYIANGKILFVIDEASYKEPEIYDRSATIAFKHYSEVYSSSVVKKLSPISAPDFSIAADRIFSSMSIGYEKQDYDSKNNGGDEFNFNITYLTGKILKEAKNEMICPYRADCYGISELITKRDDETSTSDSDNDMFAVKVKDGGSVYNIDRDITVKGAYSDSVFNAKLSPRYMIEANKSMIGMYCEKLSFASSTGNSDIVIDGKSVSGDVDISERIITAGNMEVETDDMELPTDWNGEIQFDWDGYRYLCYLSSVELNYTKTMKYKLIEKSRTCIE